MAHELRGSLRFHCPPPQDVRGFGVCIVVGHEGTTGDDVHSERGRCLTKCLPWTVNPKRLFGSIAKRSFCCPKSAQAQGSSEASRGPVLGLGAERNLGDGFHPRPARRPGFSEGSGSTPKPLRMRATSPAPSSSGCRAVRRQRLRRGTTRPQAGERRVRTAARTRTHPR